MWHQSISTVYYCYFFVAPLGEWDQVWNWSILWNGVLKFFSEEISQKKSGSWRTKFHSIDQFQNWPPSPRGATKEFEKKCARLFPVTVYCLMTGNVLPGCLSCFRTHKQYNCHYCHKTSTRLDIYMQHTQQCSMNPNKTKLWLFQCKTCLHKFTSKSYLDKHVSCNVYFKDWGFQSFGVHTVDWAFMCGVVIDILSRYWVSFQLFLGLASWLSGLMRLPLNARQCCHTH